MRIPLPTSIPVGRALLFSSLLVLVEFLEGTDPLYSLLVFAFFMLSVFAFNVARGFSRPSGAYIFFFSVLVVDIGTVYKALLGQPAQSHLDSPLLLMSIYVAAMAAMLLAAFLSRKIATSRDGVAGMLGLRRIDYGSAALGSFLLFFALYGATLIFSESAGGVLRALSQINQFLPLSIMLGTIAAVQGSGGRRSTSALTLVAMVYAFFQNGLLSFSKQGMFTPLICWLIGVSWTRYRLRPYQLVLLVVFGYFAQTVLTPLSFLGRSEVVTGTAQERVAIIEKHLANAHDLQRVEHDQEASDELINWYFGSPQGIFDRLTMIPPDGELVNFSAQGHFFGYLAVRYYFENWVPHLIDPHKLEGVRVGGNTYAHEMGHLADADVTTGISYSPAAEAFHIDGWRGVLLLIAPILILLFVTTDSLCGDLRVQPWGLLPMLIFAHSAPEGLLGAAIWWSLFGNIGVVFAIVFCGYVAPVLGLLLKGEERLRGGHSFAPSRLPTASDMTADPV